MTKISLIFINFNKQKYLHDALESVRRQSFRNWECIIVDDGSTDGSRKIISAFCKRDPRFRMISRENKGCAAARNTGMKAIHCEFVMFMDSDDVMTPWAMESLLAAREKHGADITYGLAKYARDDYKMSDGFPPKSRCGPLLRADRGDFHKLLDISPCTFNYCWCWLCLFPRALLDGLLWNSDMRKSSDCVFMINALARADSIAVVDSFVSMHRDSYCSLSREAFNVKSVEWGVLLAEHAARPLREIGGPFRKRLYKIFWKVVFHNNIMLPLRTGKFREESAECMRTAGLPSLREFSLMQRLMLWIFIKTFEK